MQILAVFPNNARFDYLALLAKTGHFGWPSWGARPIFPVFRRDCRFGKIGSLLAMLEKTAGISTFRLAILGKTRAIHLISKGKPVFIPPPLKRWRAARRQAAGS